MKGMQFFKGAFVSWDTTVGVVTELNGESCSLCLLHSLATVEKDYDDPQLTAAKAKKAKEVIKQSIGDPGDPETQRYLENLRVVLAESEAKI
jgi:hypothetical protein